MTAEKARAGFPVRLFAPALAAIAVLIALGVWQVERRAWKLDLIARVESRIHAAPADAPGPGAWPSVSDASDSYRRIRARGVFMNGKTTYVQASTVLGMGYWVVTPLREDRGFTVLVNRGFVPARGKEENVPGHTAVTGLLRVTEPGGRWMRPNDPAGERWYSRDVAAIAAARGLGGDTAPYFIDAGASEKPGSWPAGGLTVVSFPNNHAVYAFTWFGLALALAAATWLAARQKS